MSSRIGVDIGGTFTDFICYDESGNKVVIDKIPTTPDAPEKAVIEVIKRNLTKEHLGKVDFFLHGTTVGLNSLLERKGSKVGLVCTKGFRDILEIRRGDRDEMYNLFWQPKPPLVPRYLRLEVEERIFASGDIHSPINNIQLKEVCNKLIEEKVNSIAIALINSYANKKHEVFIETTLRELGFKGQISLSSIVSGEYREYERTTTTVIDAFVKSRMSNYLNTLKKEMNSIGFNGGYLVTRSGSGSMTFDEAEDRPFETIMSGPVAGAEGAGELSRKLKNINMVTADVGGTSFDTCLIINGRPQIQYEGTIVGLPVQSPWVDVRSIGAGGGSIAWLENNALRVGPKSAGANPGPACYDKGGQEPTVTDANLFLGRLGSGSKLGGWMKLNVKESENSLLKISKELSITPSQLAEGILSIINAKMADAIRTITVKKGIDPREFSLVAFGGAGSMHAVWLAAELEIDEIIVPNDPGTFSAWGMLQTDIRRDLTVNFYNSFADLNEEKIKDAFNKLKEEAIDLLKIESVEDENMSFNLTADMRYVGQEYYVNVEIDKIIDLNKINNDFHGTYKKQFGHSTPDGPLEFINLRLVAEGKIKKSNSLKSEKNLDKSKDSLRKITFDNKDFDTKVLDRSNVESKKKIDGPLIIEEETATTVIPPNYILEKDEFGNLIITKEK